MWCLRCRAPLPLSPSGTSTTPTARPLESDSHAHVVSTHLLYHAYVVDRSSHSELSHALLSCAAATEAYNCDHVTSLRVCSHLQVTGTYSSHRRSQCAVSTWCSATDLYNRVIVWQSLNRCSTQRRDVESIYDASQPLPFCMLHGVCRQCLQDATHAMLRRSAQWQSVTTVKQRTAG